MNRKIKVLLASVTTSVVFGGVFLANKTGETVYNQPYAKSFAVIPGFPAKVTFAGEEVDLSHFDMRERYERELTSFCYTHNLTLALIKRANRYFPIIEPIIKEEGLPEDFIYLMAIESSIDPRIVSYAKAAGLWQIMPTTGKELGLEVNSHVDERFHIAKSTRAAAKYLKSAYAKYGSWITAASSYNAGQGRISSELKAQEVDSSLDLLLVEETSRYAFRMMALKAIMQNPRNYGFLLKSDQLYKPIRTKEVEVNTTISSLATFAKNHGITYKDLKLFNPWLRDRSLPNSSGKKYYISIPYTEDLNYSSVAPVEVYRKNWVVD